MPASARSRTVVKSTYIISDLSPDVRNTADFSLAGGTVSADASDDRHDSVIYDFVYMKVALEAGPRRETIHGRAFSEIVSSSAPRANMKKQPGKKSPAELL